MYKFFLISIHDYLEKKRKNIFDNNSASVSLYQYNQPHRYYLTCLVGVYIPVEIHLNNHKLESVENILYFKIFPPKKNLFQVTLTCFMLQFTHREVLVPNAISACHSSSHPADNCMFHEYIKYLSRPTSLPRSDTFTAFFYSFD